MMMLLMIILVIMMMMMMTAMITAMMVMVIILRMMMIRIVGKIHFSGHAFLYFIDPEVRCEHWLWTPEEKKIDGHAESSKRG